MVCLSRTYNGGEHGGINGLTPSEMFLQTFNRLHNRNNTKQKKFHLCGYLKVSPIHVSTTISYYQVMLLMPNPPNPFWKVWFQ
jgi:hypothetical protein